MINMTVRFPSGKKFAVCSICIIGVLIIAGFVIQGGATAGGYDSTSAQIMYAKSRGWEVSDKPTAVKSFTVADEFDRNMTLYNEIQQSQGFDLTEYKGCEVTRYTYELKNYPNYTDGMKLSLIVYNGNIIAGDIQSATDSGFMHGFDLDGANIDIKET